MGDKIMSIFSLSRYVGGGSMLQDLDNDELSYGVRGNSKMF